MKVLDAGANAGYYTLALSRWVGSSGHVWAVEPFAENANNLLTHLSINQISNTTVIQAALSSHEGLTGFTIAASNSMGGLSSNREYLVPATTIDGLISAECIEQPDIVKMDIEGAESAALLGASELLRSGKAIWFIALHGDDQRRECYHTLRSADYVVRSLDGRDFHDDQFTDREIVATPPRFVAFH